MTTQMVEAPVVTGRSHGAIGVDLNADHLAVVETDASGNPVNSFSIPLVTYGRSQRQAEAVIGDAVACIVDYARDAGKPIVMEKLDFRQKQALLEGESRRYSRMLSSFSYDKVRSCFLSRGSRQWVEVYQVNPAFSSVMARVKFMERYGISVHQAAALVLARRFLGCSESIPRLRFAPLGNGVRVAFRTRKEADEARVDPLGVCSGTVESGAYRTPRAGEVLSGGRPQSGSGSGLSGDRFRVPGWDSRAESPSTVGAAVRQWRIF
ncbi:MAG: hypothetical protein OXR67_05080 [Chloroflexota bacterium]|nr:hypothetical protein [Chloroflexota bacterium]